MAYQATALSSFRSFANKKKTSKKANFPSLKISLTVALRMSKTFRLEKN